MAEQKRIYNWYLVLAMGYSVLSIFLLLLSTRIFLWNPIWNTIDIVWFAINIFMFIVILKKKLEKVALWLPGLYIFNFVFSLFIGIIVINISAKGGYPVLETLEGPILRILWFIIPIITLVIATKLLFRKNSSD